MNLRIVLVSVMALVGCMGVSVAKEAHGKWNHDLEVEYTMKMIDVILAEQKQRNEMLELYTPELKVELKYRFFDAPEDSKIGKAMEKYKAGNLKGKLMEALLKGMAKDLRTNQALLAAAEKKAFKLWKPKQVNLDNIPTEKKEAKLIGQKVEAIHIGVVLDNSPSMKDYIAALRKDVKSGFRYHKVYEVGACHLSPWGRGGAWFFAEAPAYMNPFDPQWYSHVKLGCLEGRPHSNYLGLQRNSEAAMEALVMQGVDTIYWLSDFKDDRDKKVAEEIVKLLKKHNVRLYMHTVKSRPRKDALVEYAKKTGSVKKVKLRR